LRYQGRRLALLDRRSLLKIYRIDRDRGAPVVRGDSNPLHSREGAFAKETTRVERTKKKRNTKRARPIRLRKKRNGRRRKTANLSQVIAGKGPTKDPGRTEGEPKRFFV